MKNIIGFLLLALIYSCGGSPEKEAPTLVKKEIKNSAFENTNSDLGTKSKDEPDTFMQNETLLSIKLTPFVTQFEGIGETGSKLLKDRINSAITKIGYGGEGANPRYIIGPSISLLSKNVTSTAPPKYANTYEINIMVVDVITETVFNNYTTEFKGIGDSQEKAFISGIRNINFNNQEFMNFLTKSEEKMVKYFENNCSTILSEANAEASMRNYDNAFAILKSVPVESKECFTEIQTKKVEYFKLSLNSACDELLAKMKAELGKFNDSSGSGFNPQAMNYYSMIDRESKCYDEAQKEYKKYISKLNPKAKRDWNQKMREYNDEIAMVKADKEFKREEAKLANDYEIKLAEIEAKRHIEGNQKLLAKYKHDESPWLIRVFSSGSKLFKGEMNTD